MAETDTRKRALVTGGGRGLGSAIVRALAAAGNDVTFTYRSASAEVTPGTSFTAAIDRVRTAALAGDKAAAWSEFQRAVRPAERQASLLTDPLTPYTTDSWATGTNPAVNSHYLRILVANPAIKGKNYNFTTLEADLTVKGTTASMPMRANVTVRDDGAVCLTSQTTVNRKKWGVTGNMLGMVGDKTTLSTNLVFRRAA